jgi:hypothetical protein
MHLNSDITFVHNRAQNMKLKIAKAIRILLAKKSMMITLKAVHVCSRSGKTTTARGGTEICDAATLIIAGRPLAVSYQQLARTTNRKV